MYEHYFIERLRQHAAGRGHRGGPFGHGGGPFGHHRGGPFGFGRMGGGDEFPRGRRFSSEDLQLLLLSLLSEQPSHGYELIKGLEERSHGAYSPSPGMVYPALTYLEELGHVNVQAEGNRKRYSLSESGRNFLESERERVAHLFEVMALLSRRMDMYRRAVADEERSPSDEDKGWLPELLEARQRLDAVIDQARSLPLREQFKVAEALARTAEKLAHRLRHDE
jgi:DNA-binding PadR family transcriptional regulator